MNPKWPGLTKAGVVVGLSIACAGWSAAASSQGSAGAPAPSAGGAACRNYSTASTTTMVQGSFTANQSLTCSYDTTTNQLTCRMTYRDTSGCSAVADTVNTYPSVADFVDEVSVIPIRLLVTSSTTTPVSGTCMSRSTTTYSHDPERRLTRYVVGPLTYSYSAWDSAGRPRSGRITGGGSTTTEDWSYDDGARSATLRQTGAIRTVTTYTYDANGNSTGYSVVSGATTNKGTTSITSTARVCK